MKLEWQKLPDFLIILLLPPMLKCLWFIINDDGLIIDKFFLHVFALVLI